MHTLCQQIHTMDLLVIGIGLWIFSTAACNSWVGHAQSTFDLLQYGAKGDGHTDDTQAFSKAWEAFCVARGGTPTLLVPAGHTFFVRQINLTGPCQSKNVHIQIQGTILAPQRDEWGPCSYNWFHFRNVPGLTLDGSGVINGQGEEWWPRKRGTGVCSRIPTALYLERCDGLQISGLNHINGPGPHISVAYSQNVTISRVHINSPKESHNTDGIDIAHSVRVNIHDILVESGDDCVAVKGGSKFINISKVICGPGHGISVGSLGVDGSEEFVENVYVRNCTFNGSASGPKIKTWPGGRGHAREMIFENIILNQTDYSLYIDQHYMKTPEKQNAVKVSNITFSNFHGTSTGKDAVVLDCAHIYCDNITLRQINITSADPKNPASTICNYVHGTGIDIVSPSVPCLHH